MVQKNLTVLLGCTCSGKTDWIQKNKPASVINCDSRQIFKYLDIGTAKPDRELLASIRHHLVDIIELNEQFSAGEFIRKSAEILAEYENPLISCGTPFYLNALINGMDDIPPVSSDIRGKVGRMEEEMGIEALYSLLLKEDPVRAEQLNSTDSQRIKRALEVFYSTGKPISSYYKGNEGILKDFRVIYLERDRNDIRSDVTARTEHMLNTGILNETEWAMEKYGRDVLISKKIIGYNECIEYIDGKINREALAASIITSTMQYVKRQETFFRKMLSTLDAVSIDRA